MSYRLLIADTEALIVDAFSALVSSQPDVLDVTVVATATDGTGTIEQALKTQPDLLLIDYRLPVRNGADVAAEIKRRLPETRILMLSSSDSPVELHLIADAQIDGYLSKRSSRDKLISTISRILRGERVIDALKRNEQSESVYLTRRERQVLKLISEGHRTRDIAEILNRSPRTIEKYRASLKLKLGATTPAELVALADRRQIIL